MDELLTECRSLRDLSSTAEALVRFAVTLGIERFEKKGNRFVSEPNFVTFEVHSTRVNNLTVSLRGNPEEFLGFESLPAKKSQNGYSEAKVTSPSQLLAAAHYIAHAKDLFERGRNRVQKTPRIVEA